MGCVNVMLNISPQNKTNMVNVNSWIQEDNYLILNKEYDLKKCDFSNFYTKGLKIISIWIFKIITIYQDRRLQNCVKILEIQFGCINLDCQTISFYNGK